MRLVDEDDIFDKASIRAADAATDTLEGGLWRAAVLVLVKRPDGTWSAHAKVAGLTMDETMKGVGTWVLRRSDLEKLS